MPNFGGLFTLNGILIYAAGFLTRVVYCKVKMRVLDWRHPENAPHQHKFKMLIVGWAFAGVGIVFTGVQAQVAHNQTVAQARLSVAQAEQAKQFAQTTAQCENQLRATLIDQKNLQTENDAYAAQERDLNAAENKATADYFTLVVTPPQDIFDLHTTDPRYQDWARGVTNDFVKKLQDIGTTRDQATAKREAVVTERAKHQLPEPNCGK